MLQLLLIMKLKFYYGRTDDSNKEYELYLQKKSGCSFCTIGNSDHIENEIIEQNDYFWVVKNAFPYAIFDGFEVIDHLLIVPKKHVEAIFELTIEERQNLIELISKYEIKGYSFFSRSPKNQAKSIWHQHTHLIKVI